MLMGAQGSKVYSLVIQRPPRLVGAVFSCTVSAAHELETISRLKDVLKEMI